MSLVKKGADSIGYCSVSLVGFIEVLTSIQNWRQFRFDRKFTELSLPRCTRVVA